MFCLHAKSLTCVRLFVTLWTIAYQAPLSMRFSRLKYWSGLPCPHPGDPPNPRIEPACPVLAGRFFTTSANCETFFVLQSSINHLEVNCNFKFVFFFLAPRFLTLIRFCHTYCVSFKAKPHS